MITDVMITMTVMTMVTVEVRARNDHRHNDITVTMINNNRTLWNELPSLFLTTALCSYWNYS